MATQKQIIEKTVTEIAKEHNFVSYNLEMVPTTSGGANYTTSLYNITIIENNKVVYLFAKFAAMSEKMRLEFPTFYETEIFAYTKLANIYERLQDIQQVPEKHRLAFPKLYGCNSRKLQETIILENLFMKGYQNSDRLKSINWKYATSAVKELAKMHALAFAYKDFDSEEFLQTVDNCKSLFNYKSERKSGFSDILIMKAVEFVSEENKEKFLRFFRSDEKEKLYGSLKSTRIPVIGHGDYRPSNLMHKIRDDGTLDIKIVDLQTLQGASPVVDLLFFIFTGSDEQFRAQYYEKLLDHYYMELEAAMKRLHLNPEETYSRKDFELDLKEKLSVGLLIAVFVLPVVTVAEENAPQVNKDTELSSFSVEKTSDLYSSGLTELSMILSTGAY